MLGDLMEDLHVELTDFLLARIAEAEHPARVEVERLRGAPRRGGKATAARRLVDCEVKRRIVELHKEDREHQCPNEDGTSDLYGHLYGWGEEADWPQRCVTLRLLALPYADHPEYREEWAPPA